MCVCVLVDIPSERSKSTHIWPVSQYLLKLFCYFFPLWLSFHPNNLIVDLVGAFNPFEKYESNWKSSLSMGENQKYLSCHHLGIYCWIWEYLGRFWLKPLKVQLTSLLKADLEGKQDMSVLSSSCYLFSLVMSYQKNPNILQIYNTGNKKHDSKGLDLSKHVEKNHALEGSLLHQKTWTLHHGKSLPTKVMCPHSWNLGFIVFYRPPISRFGNPRKVEPPSTPKNGPWSCRTWYVLREFVG